MTDSQPAIGPILARLSGGKITDTDYVGYFMNEYGEEIVFAQSRGEKTARLWHSDTDWEMYRIGDHSIRLDGPMDGMITVGDDLIINREEVTWLSACLAASRHLRQTQA